jgi:Acyclic terpene utilisation family protein AtuA
MDSTLMGFSNEVKYFNHTVSYNAIANPAVPADSAPAAGSLPQDACMAVKTITIRSGAAWWCDRVEPAALTAEHGELDYLWFETMAEATISAAQVRVQHFGSAQSPSSTALARCSIPTCTGTRRPLFADPMAWLRDRACAHTRAGLRIVFH